jgi:hypothetical protein
MASLIPLACPWWVPLVTIVLGALALLAVLIAAAFVAGVLESSTWTR